VRLVRSELRLARRVHGSFDAAIVGYPGHLDVLSLRRALPDTPLVLNPLVALTDTLVEDRSRFGPTSAAGRFLAAVDRRAFTAADVVVADTCAHGELFARLGARHVEICRVGADERVFHPPWTPAQPPHVLFVGKLIPLHGVGTIVAAARALPEVSFRVVGDGQDREALGDRPPNVAWLRWLEFEELGAAYRRATCALGIFGTSAKACRVIPNKAYHALASGAPLVTADTPAARELLADDESAVLVRAGDAAALATALRRVLADEAFRRRLSAGGRAAYESHASEDVLARRWRAVVERAAR
jgi:glycosyltransferase involved in cell wall biosynthesis